MFAYIVNGFPKRIGLPVALFSIFISGLFGQTADAAVHNVTTPQEFQTALSQSAANGDNDTINLAAGYYIGNFNFNSTEAYSLTVQAASGLSSTDVTIDGDANGNELVISVGTEVADITVQNITFKRNCGDIAKEGLQINTLGNVAIQSCRFLGTDSAAGRGIYIIHCQGLNVDQNIVTCTNSATGAGIHCSSANASVSYTDNVVNGNNGPNVRAFYHSGGAPILFKDNTMNFNKDGVYQGYGATLYCNGYATLEGNNFIGNIAIGTYRYSIIYLNDGGHLSDNVISANAAVRGYALYIKGSAHLEGNTVSNTDGYSTSAYYGGGVYVTGNATVIDNVFSDNYYEGLRVDGTSTVTGNTVTGNGGGIQLKNSSTVSGNTISDNTRTYYSGGGIQALNAAASFTFSSNSISGNRSQHNHSSYGQGGGIWVEGSAVFTENIISGNYALYHGGGVAARGVATFEDNTISANSAGGVGGGVYVGSTSTAVFRRNVFDEDSSIQNGGAAYVDVDGAITFINNQVTRSSGDQGGGLALFVNSSLDMINNTVSDCLSANNGGGVWIDIDGTDENINLYNNIVWGNRATSGSGDDIFLGGGGAQKNLYYNDVNGLYGVWDFAVGNMDRAPLFVNALTGDYHLRNGSPVADAADASAPNLPLVDLDLYTRNPLTVDIGCYELANTGPHPADSNTDWTISQSEYDAYRVAWRTDTDWTIAPVQISVDYVTRAGYLLDSGGTYHNDAGAKPVCWKPGS